MLEGSVLENALFEMCVLSPDPLVDPLFLEKQKYIEAFLQYLSQDGGVV